MLGLSQPSAPASLPATEYSACVLRVFWKGSSDSPRIAGWRRIMCTAAGHHPYAGAWWPDAHVIGYEHTFVHQVADFLKDLETGSRTSPTFREALETAAVCDAVLDSAEQGKWEQVAPTSA